MKNSLVVLCLVVISNSIFAQDLILPAKQVREDLINRNAYACSYNEGYELSTWVSYLLTTEEAKQSAEAKVKYKEDPDIMTNTATIKDYKKTGYAPAQLIPSEHFTGQEDVQEQLGYFTNIVPMKPAFYTMTWKNMEKLFRAWCILDNTNLYVVSGPMLNDGPYKTIGDNKVSLPGKYYQAVYDAKNNRAVGFILKNSYQSNTFATYAMSIDALEKIIGIDLFTDLDDAIETEVESNYSKEVWNWEAIEAVYPE